MTISFAPAAVVVYVRGERLPRHFAVSIALVVLLHLALLWLATSPVHIPLVRDNRVWVQLLRQEPSLTHIHKRRLPSIRAPSQNTQIPSSPTTVAPVPPTVPETTTESPEEHALLADTTATKTSAGTRPVDVVQQALMAAGAIDRQLRSEHRQDFTAPPDTPGARLAKGFAAAHAAVKPKWFEAARAELISAPNDPKRIYRITTAMGEYCLYYPDKGSISANSNTRSGLAGFGQPTAAQCPIPF